MTGFTVVAPRVMQFGRVSGIAGLLTQFGLRRPLIVTDPVMVSTGLLRRCTDPLTAARIAFTVFSDTIPEPEDTVIDTGAALLRDAGFDCLVAFGGGSPIDTAKAMAILAPHPGRHIRDFKAPVQNDFATLPIIAIPTTAGTGSECTRFTVITDTERGEKMLIAGMAALPLAAIIDYELTVSVPKRTTADTGVDSLTHALEAYVSRRANPISDALALSAMRLIGQNLRTAYTQPSDPVAREAMMLGATQAGLAFSNSSVALVHGMSRPIGARFHVPHGLSNAMLLPAITRFGLASATARYAAAARAACFTDAADDAQAADALCDGLLALNRDLAVPSPQGYDIAWPEWEAAMDTMADQAIASGSPANNPRVPDKSEIITLYRAIYAGSNA